jgi:YggT family protein
MAYGIVCALAVLSSWFMHRDSASRVLDFLRAAAEPWLSVFRSRKVGREGLDFGPVIAVSILFFASDLLTRLGAGRVLTLGIVLAELLLVVWQVIASILVLFAGLAAVRLVAYLAKWNTFGAGWKAVEATLNPTLYRVNRLLFGHRIVGYVASLVWFIFAFAAIWTAGLFAVPWLAATIRAIAW